MTSEAPSLSSQLVQQQPPSSVGKNVQYYITMPMAVEFPKFLQDPVTPRRVPSAPDIVHKDQRTVDLNFNQNRQLVYEDLNRLIGLSRRDSECGSNISEFGLGKGHAVVGENGACINETRKHYKRVGAVGEMNILAPSATTVNPYESPYSNCPSDLGVLDISQSGKLKFLCSFGGKFLPRPGDGKLRYVGGETHIISVRQNISWKDLERKTLNTCNQSHTIKYQLPGEDLDALISVSCDEDLQNMIEEYNGLEKLGVSQKIRLFLIPLGDSESEAPIIAGTMQQNNPDYQYFVAVNSNSVPLSNSTEQCLAREMNQVQANSAQFLGIRQISPCSLHALETSDSPNVLHPTQFLNEPRKFLGFPYQPPPFPPLPLQQRDSKDVHTLSPTDKSVHLIEEIGNSFITLTPESAHTNASNFHHPLHGAANSMNTHHGNKQVDVSHLNSSHEGHLHNCSPSRECVPPVVFDQTKSKFDAFSCERVVHEGRTFHSENPSSLFEDPMSLFPGTNDPVGSHLGMPHAFSDSQLQQQGARSAYHSLEGISPSCLSFSNAQLSSLPVSGALQGLHENNGAVKLHAETNLLSVGSTGFQSRLDVLNLRNVSMNGVNRDTDEVCKVAAEDVNKPLLALLHQDQVLNESRLSHPVEGYKTNFPNVDYVPTPIHNVNTTEEILQGYCGQFPLPATETSADTQTSPLDETLSDLSTKGHVPLPDRMNGEQGSSVPWTGSPKTAGISPSSLRQSNNKSTLTDLLCEIYDNLLYHDPHELQPIASQKNNAQPPMVINSRDLCPYAASDDVDPNSMQKTVTTDSFQNPNKDNAHRREASIIDDDFHCYPDKGGPVDCARRNSSIPQDVCRERNQKESAIVAENVPDASKTCDEAPSSRETELENISEIESEEAKAYDRDKDELFSDALLAEIEAGVYGLQIIKSADLEELQELGSGTYGTVYHGKWRGTDVAIKRIKNSCFAGISLERERLTKEFWREAQILSTLHHPNVLAFYGVVPDGAGGALATVTEFMVNGSLKHVLLKKDRSLDLRRKLIIAMDAAFGMEYLHSKNIVHFDLKCDNLLVNIRDPHRPICKVADFGLSRIKRNTLVTGGVRGTLPWMAPELLNGSSNRVSEKVDVFSFGIAMWEIFTEEEPYATMHYGAIIGGIVKNTLRPPVPERCDPDWRNLMEHCWSPDPESRPSFTEITNRLRSMSASIHEGDSTH